MKKTFPVAISLHFLYDCIYFADCGALGTDAGACNAIDTCVYDTPNTECIGKYVFGYITH